MKKKKKIQIEQTPKKGIKIALDTTFENAIEVLTGSRRPAKSTLIEKYGR